MCNEHIQVSSCQSRPVEGTDLRDLISVHFVFTFFSSHSSQLCPGIVVVAVDLEKPHLVVEGLVPMGHVEVYLMTRGTELHHSRLPMLAAVTSFHIVLVRPSELDLKILPVLMMTSSSRSLSPSMSRRKAKWVVHTTLQAKSDFCVWRRSSIEAWKLSRNVHIPQWCWTILTAAVKLDLQPTTIIISPRSDVTLDSDRARRNGSLVDNGKQVSQVLSTS
jgi:hypothetical protein